MKTMVMNGVAALAVAAAGGAAAQTAASPTVEEIRDRGHLNCGINAGLAGFAYTDAQGNWEGFDVALCRAVAAAILGDETAVEFRPTTPQDRFEALRGRQIDLLSRNTTWTFSRDNDLGLEFAGVNYYDGQGFIVPRELGVESALELDGATICIQTGTTTELNLADYFRKNDISYEPVPIADNTEARQRYLAEACDVYTDDASALAAQRATFENPQDHVILPEIISKEPLGPAVRHGDQTFGDIVRWVLNALIIAEEFGVTQENVETMAAAPTDMPEVNRLLGTEGEYGAMLGLEPDFAKQAIAAVGNYGEIFDRYIGPDTQIGLDRGLNALWTEGGILYAPPFR